MSAHEKEAPSASDSSPVSVMTDALRERLRSPFFSAVLIAWVVINWRAILFVAFDSSSILARILFVDEYFLTFWKSAALPIIAAFVYVATSPWSSDAIAWWRGKAERRINCRKLEDLDVLAKKQREINDPGGLKREMTQLNEDISRAKEFLAKAKTAEAETKNRTATLEREGIEKNKLLESENQRHKAAREQLENDIQGLSKSKNDLFAQTSSLKEELSRIRDMLSKETGILIDAERAKKIARALRHRGVPIAELRHILKNVGMSDNFISDVTSAIIATPQAIRKPPPSPT